MLGALTAYQNRTPQEKKKAGREASCRETSVLTAEAKLDHEVQAPATLQQFRQRPYDAEAISQLLSRFLPLLQCCFERRLVLLASRLHERS